MSIQKLNQIAKDLGVTGAAGLRKQELIFKILQTQAEKSGLIFSEGVLECLPDGFGFLRAPEYNYLPGPGRRLRFAVADPPLRSAHRRHGLRPDSPAERRRALLRADQGRRHQLRAAGGSAQQDLLRQPDAALSRRAAEARNRARQFLRPRDGSADAHRQGPARADRRGAAHRQDDAAADASPTRSRPIIRKSSLIVLLIDERPEEVTDMQRSVQGEVISSTFDEPASRHVQVAEMVIEKAKRLVEHKSDVVILLDSITRLARAYNTVVPPSGKVLSGGVDSNALQRPKRFFGAARNIEEGGSLTIVATALIDTGSRMDDVIFEEFKGTGNMEIHLDRKLMDKRVFPAIDINKSGTRKEELLMPREELNRVWILRKVSESAVAGGDHGTAARQARQDASNAEFLAAMSG